MNKNQSDVHDICKKLNITEDPDAIYQYINREWLIDWSECTWEELQSTIIYVAQEIRRAS